MKRLKKILYILHYPPPTHGAAMVGQYIMDSELLKSSFRSKYINLGTSKSVEEIGNGGVIKLMRFLKMLVKIVKNQLIYRPDLVYITPAVNPVGIYKDCIVSVLVKTLGGKVVYHLHNKGVALQQHKRLENFLYRIFFKNSFVILLSKSLYQDIRKYVSKEQVFFCPNGIPMVETSQFVSRKKDDSPKVQILFLSNLLRAKGVLVLLEALNILRDENLSFRCNFVGGEGDITAVQFRDEIRKYRLQDYAFYLGSKYGRQKHEAYATADVFVFPTYNETFGLVNLEAMQFSLPVVSTQEGGISDVVIDGETGFLVKPKDTQELALRLKMLIQDESLRRVMGKAGKERYETKFTLTDFENNIKLILEQLTS